MTDFLDGLAFGELFATFTLIVFLRAQATYWIARGAVTGAASTRWGRWLRSPAMERGSRMLARWGPPAVTASFLTVGLQTLLNGAAGAARMRWLVYLAAMLPGCLAWALVYSSIGFTVLWASIGAAAGSPGGVAVLVSLAMGLTVLITLGVRRRRRAEMRQTVAS